LIRVLAVAAIVQIATSAQTDSRQERGAGKHRRAEKPGGGAHTD